MPDSEHDMSPMATFQSPHSAAMAKVTQRKRANHNHKRMSISPVGSSPYHTPMKPLVTIASIDTFAHFQTPKRRSEGDIPKLGTFYNPKLKKFRKNEHIKENLFNDNENNHHDQCIDNFVSSFERKEHYEQRASLFNIDQRSEDKLHEERLNEERLNEERLYEEKLREKLKEETLKESLKERLKERLKEESLKESLKETMYDERFDERKLDGKWNETIDSPFEVPLKSSNKTSFPISFNETLEKDQLFESFKCFSRELETSRTSFNSRAELFGSNSTFKEDMITDSRSNTYPSFSSSANQNLTESWTSAIKSAPETNETNLYDPALSAFINGDMSTSIQTTIQHGDNFTLSDQESHINENIDDYHKSSDSFKCSVPRKVDVVSLSRKESQELFLEGIDDLEFEDMLNTNMSSNSNVPFTIHDHELLSEFFPESLKPNDQDNDWKH